jgi:predicted nuclease of predicted toxin-antitoxin system
VKFLLDANLPRAAQAALRECGHEALHVRDLGLGDASDDVIAAAARNAEAVLASRDLDFADMRRFDPIQYPGILVLRIPDDAVAQEIANLLADFVRHHDLSRHIPGHLVILERGRVRFRPALPR